MKNTKESILNKFTVEEFTEIYPESIQDKMSELTYYVENGKILIGKQL